MTEMFDFEALQESRKIQQKDTERRATGELKRQKRTQLCLSVTESDKMKLQRYALEHGVTAAAVIHNLIEQYIH